MKKSANREPEFGASAGAMNNKKKSVPLVYGDATSNNQAFNEVLAVVISLGQDKYAERRYSSGVSPPSWQCPAGVVVRHRCERAIIPFNMLGPCGAQSPVGVAR